MTPTGQISISSNSGAWSSGSLRDPYYPDGFLTADHDELDRISLGFIGSKTQGHDTYMIVNGKLDRE